MRPAAAALLLGLLVAGCAITTVETPDPASIPAGPLEPGGDDATGPIVELASGQEFDTGWRYSIYPSEAGWCTQLETVGLVSTGCGDLPPAEEVGAFGAVGRGTLEATGVHVIEGLVGSTTATVWLIGENGFRTPAVLLPLEDAGLEANAFLGFAPPDATLTHVMAVKSNGDVLETYELP
jgi:hypothetical protein